MTDQDKATPPPTIADDLESLEVYVRKTDPSKLPPRSRAAHARLLAACARLSASARDFDAASHAFHAALLLDEVELA